MQTLKSEIYKIVCLADEKGSLSWYFDMTIIVMIVLNIVAIVLDSVPEIHAEYADFFYQFEVFSVVIFSIEYLARIYSITENEKFSNPFFGRLKFAFTPFAIIDLLAILPFFLVFFLPDLRVLRMFRAFRLIRILKIFRFMHAVTIIDDVLSKRKDELLVSFMFILMIMFLSSSVMYYCEHPVQPTKFSSIPETLWWGVMTLTTVGYGDVYPISPLGKFFGSIISIVCIALFALPAGILASGFTEELRNRKKKK